MITERNSSYHTSHYVVSAQAILRQRYLNLKTDA